ncbi:MAG: hypothetical protein IJY21_01955 [Clostridia bacterium]|nr:hypothetical protein [Clostridia bacterium]
MEEKGRLPNGLFTALRFFIIIMFLLFAVCSFAFYAAPTMMFMGEKGETVYELAKLEEAFAKNLLVFAYVIVGFAVVVGALFILPQTANRKYYVVWLHEIVAFISTVLCVCVLIQVCKGIDFVKEWGFETGAGLILPLVFIILGLTANLLGVFLWRFFGGERALKEDAQAYVSTVILPSKPTEVEKPLTRMPLSINLMTKFYKRKCYYTIVMWGIVFAVFLLAGILMGSAKNGIHPIYLLHLHRGSVNKRYDLLSCVVFALLIAACFVLIVMCFTAIVFRLGAQKKVWNFKHNNTLFIIGQVVFVVAILIGMFVIYLACNNITKLDLNMLNHNYTCWEVSSPTDFRAKCLSLLTMLLLGILIFEIYRILLQNKIRKLKKNEDFSSDVVYYENHFLERRAEYKTYRAELRAYNLQMYRYRRAQTALE